MPIEGVQALVDVHEGLRAAAWLNVRRSTRSSRSTRSRATGCTAFPARATPSARRSTHPDAILVRSHDMHAMAIPASVQGDRPRRRGHQQHSGRGDVEARRSRLQCAGRQRQRGEGAGARRAADGRAQRRAGACATSAASMARAPDLETRVEDGKKQFAGVELPQRTLGHRRPRRDRQPRRRHGDQARHEGRSGFDPEITVDAAWRLPSSVRRAHSDRGAAEAVRLRDAARAADRGDAPPDRREAPRGDEAGRGAAQFRARRARRRGRAARRAARAGTLKYYLCDFPSARAAAASPA